MVSLGIAYAFNILLYICISQALGFHRFPRYMNNLVKNYQEDREATYVGSHGHVLQGSVLGPLL